MDAYATYANNLTSLFVLKYIIEFAPQEIPRKNIIEEYPTGNVTPTVAWAFNGTTYG